MTSSTKPLWAAALFLLPLLSCRPVPPVLRVTFLDVGQGDATVIETPSGRVVVVDGGGIPQTDEREGSDPGSRVVVPFLRSRGISTIDLLVATHPDDDHVQGLVAVTERLQVRAALDSGLPASVGPCARLRAAWKVRGIRTHTARRGQSFDLGGGVWLDVLHPAEPLLHGTRSDDNNNAIVLRLRYGQVRVLLTADAEQDAEQSLLRSGQDLRAQVLKVGHHGSRGSSSAAFLAAVHPEQAVLSCGRNNRFGHPHRETLERLRGVTLWRTDQQGAVRLETEGREVHFSQVR